MPDPEKGYVSSYILSQQEESAECMGEDNVVRVASKDDYCKQNPPKVRVSASNCFKPQR